MLRNFFYGWWIVAACFIIVFYVSGVIFYGFTAFFQPLVKEYGWSHTQISFAASLRGLEMGIFAPLVGFLVDRFGSRKLILFGVITSGFGIILLSFTQSLAIFYGSFLLIALGAGGCTSVVTMTAVANWFDKNVGKALGLMASGFGASGLIIPFIVWLIDRYDWKAALLILGLGMWIIGVPLSFVIRNRPEEYGYLPDGKLENSLASSRQSREKAMEITFRAAIRKKSFLYLNIAEAIRMMTVTAVITHIMPYLSEVGISRNKAGLAAAGIPLFSVIGRFGFGWLGDYFEKRYVMAVAFSSMCIGIVAFCYAQVPWIIIVFLLFFSPSYGGSLVLRGSILREYFGRTAFGKMSGIIMGSGSFGGILGPTLAGWMFDVLGSYHFIWFVFAGTLGFAILLVLRIRE